MIPWNAASSESSRVSLFLWENLDRHVDRSPVVITIDKPFENIEPESHSWASTLAPRISLAPSLTASRNEAGSLVTWLSVWLRNSRSIASSLNLASASV